MARRNKLPSSSKKSVTTTVAPAMLQRPDEPAAAELETGPVVAIVSVPPIVDAASEMTRPMIAAELEALLAPDEIVRGDPDAPAPPPGRAPRGDCRSLRRSSDGVPALFALIYRHGTALISRKGPVGCAGEWTIVDYPTTWAAASAYAREAGWLIAAGYVDVG